ncbi:MAG: PilX N-terminal domain-containing pilus assembly protein [Bacillota bacterium]
MSDHKIYIHTLNSEKGMALVLVFVFTAVLMVCGTTLMTYALNEKLIANYQNQDIFKYYLAESGVEIGLAVLQNDFFYDSEIRGTNAHGFFIVNFEDLPESERVIISEGCLDEYCQVLRVTVKNDPEGGLIITDWVAP